MYAELTHLGADVNAELTHLGADVNAELTHLGADVYADHGRLEVDHLCAVRGDRGRRQRRGDLRVVLVLLHLSVGGARVTEGKQRARTSQRGQRWAPKVTRAHT